MGVSERLSQLAADPRWHDHSGPQPLAEMALRIGDVLSELVAVVKAAERIALRPTATTALDLDIALAALDHALGSDWPKAGYERPMFGGTA